MNLTKRSTHAAPDWCTVGATVHAIAPTVQRPLSGIVHAVDGVVVTLLVSTGMLVAVDIEDCRDRLSLG